MGPARLWTTFRYVQSNLIRAGLAEQPVDYEWSSAEAHFSGHDRRRLLNMQFFRRSGGVENWRQLFDMPVPEVEYRRLRKLTHAGQPLGDELLGVGKSFVACALSQKACRDRYSALYTRAQSLFRDLATARTDGNLRSLLSRFGRIDVLVIDDWAMAPLSKPERRNFWEICEDRYQARSTILTSQLPVSRWHEQIGDPTLADGILDRLVRNAHRIQIRGDSMRKNRGKPNA